MPPPPQANAALAGSFRVLNVFGISFYVHWSWLLVAGLSLKVRADAYESQVWNFAEYGVLIVIVLLHEVGHVLACRMVGGRADEVVLWPLGGAALIEPPNRPAASLWSFAGGPLVNLLLVPMTIGAYVYGHSQGLDNNDKGAGSFLLSVMALNLILLIFNLLPIYPLDGGQILHAILWFVVGRAKSLMVVCVIGIIGVVGFIGLAILDQNWWLGVIAFFAAIRCWSGFQQARGLAQLEAAPRHRDAECPSCGVHPVAGLFWQCDRCGARFDTFDHHGQCPGCGNQFAATACPDCGRAHPIWAWYDSEGPTRGDDER